MPKFDFFFPKGKPSSAPETGPDESGYENVVALLPRRSARPSGRSHGAAEVLALPRPGADPTDDGPPGPSAA
jgi:hypothetical protein